MIIISRIFKECLLLISKVSNAFVSMSILKHWQVTSLTWNLLNAFKLSKVDVFLRFVGMEYSQWRSAGIHLASC